MKTTRLTLAERDARRGFFRQARFDIYAYDGRWLGDTWAFDAQDACERSQAAGSPVAYAR